MFCCSLQGSESGCCFAFYQREGLLSENLHMSIDRHVQYIDWSVDSQSIYQFNVIYLKDISATFDIIWTRLSKDMIDEWLFLMIKQTTF